MSSSDNGIPYGQLSGGDVEIWPIGADGKKVPGSSVVGVCFSSSTSTTFVEYFGFDGQSGFTVPFDPTDYGFWPATNGYNGPYKDSTFKTWVETTYGLSNPTYKKAGGSVASFNP